MKPGDVFETYSILDCTDPAISLRKGMSDTSVVLGLVSLEEKIARLRQQTIVHPEIFNQTRSKTVLGISGPANAVFESF